jgi:hypothetical protein
VSARHRLPTKRHDSTIPTHQCPACNGKLSRAYVADDPTDTTSPSPGDFTICDHCGTLLVYTSALTTRLPTKQEHRHVRDDAELQAALAARRPVVFKFTITLQ